jgi:hypothetical protein
MAPTGIIGMPSLDPTEDGGDPLEGGGVKVKFPAEIVPVNGTVIEDDIDSPLFKNRLRTTM